MEHAVEIKSLVHPILCKMGGDTLVFTLLSNGTHQAETTGDIYDNGHQLIRLTFQNATYDEPLRYLELTTLMWPSNMPAENQRGIEEGMLVGRTHPFSMTQLKARTTSSMGTEVKS